MGWTGVKAKNEVFFHYPYIFVVVPINHVQIYVYSSCKTELKTAVYISNIIVEKVGVIYITVFFFAISAACLFHERSRYMWQTGHQPVGLSILFAVS